MTGGDQKTNELLRHCKLVVKGDVQGVSFRGFTLQCAEQNGITGYVKNQRDGSVLIEAEGDPHNIERFIVECRQGSKYAEIEDLTVEEGDVVGYSSFNVRV